MRMIEIVEGSGHWVNPMSVDSIETAYNSIDQTPYTEIRLREGRKLTTYQPAEECVERVNRGLRA